MSQLGFRTDIEGLRAVAVIGVLAFHITPTVLDAGFLGVDVFFVISGYLITRSILEHHGAGTFSFLDFYARRIRRLMPAYFATILFVYIVGFFVLLPPELVFLGQTSLAATLYVSNLFFMTQNDYFSPFLKSSPLLHTWSLSVEEQFYLIFPFLLLLALRRGRGAAVAAMAAAALASLALAEHLLARDAAAAFFLSPARFWQLLCGSLLAAAPQPRLPVAAAAALRYGGLAAIAGSYLLLSPISPLPGVLSLAPTLGAVAVIAAGPEPRGWMSRFGLGNPLAQFFGRISYSLYLWHWPLVVYWRFVWGEPTVSAKLGLYALSILAGYLSWRFVEAPFRGFPVERRRALFGTTAAGTAVVAAVAGALIATRGVEAAVDPAVLRTAAYMRYTEGRPPPPWRCFISGASERTADVYDAGNCIRPDGGGARAALVGDSHADHYMRGIRAVWPDLEVTQINASGCKPLFGDDGFPVCRELMRRALETWLPEGRYDRVILAARWTADDLALLPDTIARLRAHAAEVVVFGPVVEYRAPLPRLLATGKVTPGEPAGRWSLAAEKAALDRRLGEVVTAAGGRHVSIVGSMCAGSDACLTTTPDGAPVQFDYGHLTDEGAAIVLARLAAQGLDLDAPPAAPPRGDGTPHGRTAAAP
jgi:peptidoglycan/LPS O-acetylase OafA/YrhL